MNNQDLNGESIWSRTTEIPPRRPLPGDVTADAAVIGAGMAGMLTAFLLSRQGISVIVPDQKHHGQNHQPARSVLPEADSDRRKRTGPPVRLRGRIRGGSI